MDCSHTMVQLHIVVVVVVAAVVAAVVVVELMTDVEVILKPIDLVAVVSMLD